MGRSKDAQNRAKHRVSFNEAVSVFGDSLGRIIEDRHHGVGEQRFLLLGQSVRGRLLVVMFTERGRDHVRIISARRATRHERQDYEERRP
jgi:uncharacterized protein